MGQGKSPYAEAGQSNPIGVKSPMSRQRKSEIHRLPLLDVPQTHQANNHNIQAEDLLQMLAVLMQKKKMIE